MKKTKNAIIAFLITGSVFTSLLDVSRTASAAAAKRHQEQITPLTKEQLNTKVPHFYCFEYPFNPQPGKRYWLRVSDTTWIERYPDGLESRFRVLGHTMVKGAQGTILVKIAGDKDKTATDNRGGLQTFIPDKGNEVMHHWYRNTARGDDDWHDLGKMLSVE